MTHPRAEVIVYSALFETVCFDEKQRRAGNASLPLQLWRVAIGDQLVRTSSGTSHRGHKCSEGPGFGSIRRQHVNNLSTIVNCFLLPSPIPDLPQ